MATRSHKRKRTSSEVTSNTPTKAEDSIIKFDPDGDLVLVVGTGSPQELLVDSRALRRASPVFRAMLSDRFSEAKPKEGILKVELPEDDFDAFAVLMDIVHGVFDRISSKLSAQELYDMCILTNKYDMTQALRPILASEANAAYKKCSGPSHESTPQLLLLFIAWGTGQHDDFKALLMNIAYFAQPGPETTLSYEDDDLQEHENEFFYRAYASIAKYRQAILTATLDKHCGVLMCQLYDLFVGFYDDNIRCELHGDDFPTRSAVLGEYFRNCWRIGLTDGFNDDYDNPTFSGSLFKLEENFKGLAKSDLSCKCGGRAAKVLAAMAKERD
ncbi:hypothetical protein B0J13DRAFT_527941 [Dactylonectria estremocensis]|uniref:BTB domain-containing protein n=1 Tax=Dactylonectria estremocensis TaxID=1079267 RepID=A0A9P9EGZ9_9HYPO|nr:hypothetical protein B0J13DRAFT_527941 [Dactylonectria estremocensis]